MPDCLPHSKPSVFVHAALSRFFMSDTTPPSPFTSSMLRSQLPHRISMRMSCYLKGPAVMSEACTLTFLFTPSSPHFVKPAQFVPEEDFSSHHARSRTTLRPHRVTLLTLPRASLYPHGSGTGPYDGISWGCMLKGTAHLPSYHSSSISSMPL
jgi:hypothetical protein